ncbi:MAG: ABC transporter permease subunit [Chthonomonadaceae bacterium]|nr:ABC transporter permease subunit [Chthonomonadaceae bacterium]
MIGYVFNVSLKDLLRPQRSIAWLAVAGAVFAAAKVWSILAADLEPADSFDRVQQAVVLRVVALCAAVFSTLALSSEVEQGTVTFWVTRPLSRFQLLLGKWMATTVASLTVTLASYFSAAVAVLGVGAFTNPKVGPDLFALVLGVSAYTSFFVLASLYVKKPLLVTLLFAFGWETFVPNMPGDMFYLSILTYLRSAGPHTIVAGGPSIGDVITGALAPKTVDPGQAVWMLSIMSIVFLGLAARKFRNLDFLPGQNSS